MRARRRGTSPHTIQAGAALPSHDTLLMPVRVRGRRCSEAWPWWSLRCPVSVRPVRILSPFQRRCGKTLRAREPSPMGTARVDVRAPPAGCPCAEKAKHPRPGPILGGRRTTRPIGGGHASLTASRPLREKILRESGWEYLRGNAKCASSGGAWRARTEHGECLRPQTPGAPATHALSPRAGVRA